MYLMEYFFISVWSQKWIKCHLYLQQTLLIIHKLNYQTFFTCLVCSVFQTFTSEWKPFSTFVERNCSRIIWKAAVAACNLTGPVGMLHPLKSHVRRGRQQSCISQEMKKTMTHHHLLNILFSDSGVSSPWNTFSQHESVYVCVCA